MKKMFSLISLASIVFMLSACSETPKDGVSGMNMLIEIRDATTAECAGGGKAFVQGFDISGDGKIDNIASTTVSCDAVIPVAPVISKIEPCGTCHQSQNDKLVPSPHLQRAFMDTYSGWVSSDCLTCHTGGIYPNVADYKSLNATGGLVCKSCHAETVVGGFGAMHSNVGVKTLINAGFVEESMCSNLACHGTPPGHIGQGHPYPFSTDSIAGAFKSANYNAVRLNVHGDPNNRANCTPCHVGGYFEAVVVGNPTLERRATGMVLDGTTIWTTTGGASKLVENQRTRSYANLTATPDTKTGFNYLATQKGFGTWNNAAADGGALNAVPVHASKLNCTTCHDKHSTELIGNEIKDPQGTVIFSKEFMTCTSCHIVNLDAVKYDATANALGKFGYAYKLAAKYAPDKAVETNYTTLAGGTVKVNTLKTEDTEHHGTGAAPQAQRITDTHFAGKMYAAYAASSTELDVVTITAADYSSVTQPLTIQGYNINAGATNACTGCHEAHYSTVLTRGAPRDTPAKDDIRYVATNWAKSKHAAFNTAAFEGRTTGYSSTCNRCHNPVTFAYSMGGVAGANLNKEAYKTKGNVMGQSITCVACHDTSIAGMATPLMDKFNEFNLIDTTKYPNAKLRQWMSKGVALTTIKPAWVQDGLITKTLADGTTPALTSVTGSDINEADFGVKSMVCVQCHSGRNTGERIVESVHANGTTYAVGVPTIKRALTDYPHFMDIIGTINKNGPYNFTGKIYDNTISSTASTSHAKLPDTCISCHDVKEHTFKVFKNAAGEAISATVPTDIKGIINPDAGCNICHSSTSVTNTMIAAKKGYDDAIVQLKAQLASRGKYYSVLGAKVGSINYNSFWVTAPDGTTAVENWTSVDELGAAYNTLYFYKYDTGGWAHGMVYTKQIMFDSMQALGGTFTGDAAAYVGVVRP